MIREWRTLSGSGQSSVLEKRLSRNRVVYRSFTPLEDPFLQFGPCVSYTLPMEGITYVPLPRRTQAKFWYPSSDEFPTRANTYRRLGDSRQSPKSREKYGDEIHLHVVADQQETVCVRCWRYALRRRNQCTPGMRACLPRFEELVRLRE